MSFYVTMTDKSLSNWGLAKNKISKFIIICDRIEQAELVKLHAKRRQEMKYINICTKQPKYNSSRYYTSYEHFQSLGKCWKEI